MIRYVLKCDIKRYFPGIDHQILFEIISSKIRDRKVLWLIEVIIDSFDASEEVVNYLEGDDLFAPFERKRGIPIGNLTSQFFANVHLNGLDHYIKEELGCKYYIRYMDDSVIFNDDKRRLHEVKEAISDYLGVLRLRLHPDKCKVSPTSIGTDFLGFRIFPTHRLIRRENARRFIQRLKELRDRYSRGEVVIDEITRSVQGWVAHASYGDTYGLRRSLFDEMIFACSG